MREIKFRAWDGNRMWFSGQEGEEDERGNTYQLYYNGDYGTYKASLLGPQFLVTTDPYPMYHPGEEVECQLMQYVGLKDKNGKEVYEGDIVSTDLSRPYLIVEFRNGAFMYQCHHGGQDYYDHMEPAFHEEIEQTKYHEVIGNIYENLELLK